jgi:hypothetical protein
MNTKQRIISAEIVRILLGPSAQQLTDDEVIRVYNKIVSLAHKYGLKPKQ